MAFGWQSLLSFSMFLAIRTFLGWIVEGIKLTIVPSALKDMDLPGATENVSGLSAAKIGMRPEIQEKV